jgi:hypothetical protein
MQCLSAHRTTGGTLAVVHDTLWSASEQVLSCPAKPCQARQVEV